LNRGSNGANRRQATTFSELYEQFVEPHLMEERDNWDNLSHNQEFREPEGWSHASEDEERRAQEKEDQERQEQDRENQEREKQEREQEQENEEQGKGDEEKQTKDDREAESKGMESHIKKREAKNLDEESSTVEDPARTLGRGAEPQPAPQTISHPPARPRKKKPSKGQGEEPNPGEESSQPYSPEKEAFKSFAHCRRACAVNMECFQFVHYERTCKLSVSFRLGAYKAPEIDVDEEGTVTRNVTFKSGGMMDRIRDWTENNACTVAEWPVVQ